MNVIASMTTIPSRINLIKPVIDSVFKQTLPVKHLEINIPFHCLRTGEAYEIPAWLDAYEGVKIYRTEDYGAITKVAPTLERHKDDDVYVWSIDDDVLYPSRLLATEWSRIDPDRKKIIAYQGCNFSSKSYSSANNEEECMMLEGFASVLYPPRCVKDDFMEYVQKTATNLDCVKSDDVVLSNYFASLHISIFQIGKCHFPIDFSKWSMPYFNKNDALHKQDDGHLIRYLRVIRWLKEEGLLSDLWSTILISAKPLERLKPRSRYVGGMLVRTTREFFNITKK